MVEKTNRDKDRQISRRKTLLTLGTAGIAGIAGCSGNGGNGNGNGGNGNGNGGNGNGGNGNGGNGNGNGGNGNGNDDTTSDGDGDDRQPITMTTAQPESAAYATSQGIAAVINENSDMLNLSANPSDGTLQTMSLLAQGETTFGYTDVLNASDIVNNEGPYSDNPLDVELRQCWHYYDLQSGFATLPDTGIETIMDLEGRTVGWGPTAGSFHKNLRAHLEHGLDTENDMNGQDSQFGQEPSALAEGRYEAVTELRVNRDIVPSYDQEQHSINSNQVWVAWPQDVVESIQEDDSLSGMYFEADQIGGTEGWRPDLTEPEGQMWMPMTVYHMFTRPDVDGDIVYDLMMTMYENGDDLAGYHPVAEDWNDDFSFWTDELVDWIPMHEGAARFYDEVGLELPDGVSTA